MSRVTDTAKFGRVGVFYGGTSSEREVSLQSGGAVIASLERQGVEVQPIDMNASTLQQLPEYQLDRVLIMLHGPGGEDGTLQGALELYGIPYTGSGVFASAIAMDKRRCKQLWRGVGLPTAEFSVLDENTDWTAVLSALGGKAMVKPSHEGSSIGMAIASNAAELEQAWRDAAGFDSSVIAEAWLSGAEYTVAILGDEVLPPIQLQTDNSFYDYQAKYESDQTRYLCPCGLDDQRQDALKALARDAFDSLGCQGWGRVDVMTNDAGEFYLLEVNTVPGMTSHSLVPMAAAEAGYDFDALVLKILETAVI